MPPRNSRRTSQEVVAAEVDVHQGETIERPESRVMVNVERVRMALSNVEEQSVLVKQITDEVVARHSRELDEFVKNVKGLLDKIKRGEVANISDRSLEINSIKLPVLMYFAANGLEQLGCESDVAKAHRMEAYNNMLMEVQGTIPHRQAIAESRTYYEMLTETIYARAFKQLKAKIDMADKLFSALKKVLSKRMLELELARRELRTELPDTDDRDDLRDGDNNAD